MTRQMNAEPLRHDSAIGSNCNQYIPFVEIPHEIHAAANTLNSYFEQQGLREWEFACVADRRLVTKLEREIARMYQITHDNMKLLLELAAAKNKLCEVVSIARQGKYSGLDFVAVGKRLDAMDAYLSQTQEDGECALGERIYPHVVLRAKVYPDGDKWCCLYGDNLQDGVAGFGDTPAKAANAFDTMWLHGANA